MAIPVLKVKAISRGNDDWVVGAASYRAGEKLYDESAEKYHDYSNRSGIRESGIVVTPNAPDWASNREKLWNAVEANEKRKDAQLAKEVQVALPYELSNDEQKSFLLSYIDDTFTDKGIVTDWAIHDPEPANENDPRNPHAHIMFPLRTFDDEGEWSHYKSGGPDQPWDKKPFLYEMRNNWETHQNAALEDAGSDARISMKSYAEQGVDRMGGIHLGKEAYALEKEGIETDRGNKQIEIEAYNASKGWQDIGNFSEPTTTIQRVRSQYHTSLDAAQAYQKIDTITSQDSTSQDWNIDTTLPEHLHASLNETHDTVMFSQPPDDSSIYTSSLADNAFENPPNAPPMETQDQDITQEDQAITEEAPATDSPEFVMPEAETDEATVSADQEFVMPEEPANDTPDVEEEQEFVMPEQVTETAKDNDFTQEGLQDEPDIEGDQIDPETEPEDEPEM